MQKLFVTNRPNYCHRRFAEAAGCSFFHVKHYIRENVPLISLPLNGYLNSSTLPESEVYFSESIMDYYPVYYRNKGKKIILLAEDTLFKLDNMPNLKKNYIIKLLESADGFIAISDLCKRLLLKYVNKPVRVAYPFPHKEFFNIKSEKSGKKILFIGRDDKTKGFLELVEAVKMLRIHDRQWELYLVGECGRAVSKEDGINPLGFVKDMTPYIKNCSFLVHPAKFDPCPATIFEVMNAGVVPVISSNIGQTDIFIKNGLKNLILEDCRPETIACKLSELSEKDNKNISSKVVKISRDYREINRLKIFVKEFNSLIKDIGD
jgi:glycosyltransferase involved in cell wall biosynthesis